MSRIAERAAFVIFFACAMAAGAWMHDRIVITICFLLAFWNLLSMVYSQKAGKQ